MATGELWILGRGVVPVGEVLSWPVPAVPDECVKIWKEGRLKQFECCEDAKE
jgi:hypothetical protein